MVNFFKEKQIIFKTWILIMNIFNSFEIYIEVFFLGSLIALIVGKKVITQYWFRCRTPSFNYSH